MSTTTVTVDTATGELMPNQTPAPFADFLVHHMNGRVHDDATTELHQLIAAVTTHCKKGTLAVLVTVEPSRGNVDGNPISIAVSTVLKAPKGVTPSAPYYVDPEGNATKRDPRTELQPPLFGGAR